MNFSIGDAISLLGILSPLLFPLAGWLFGRVQGMLPQNRQDQLSKLAGVVVTGVQQQSNGGWTNEDKYNAAEQGLSLLAAKFGYKVSSDEARMVIEAAVAVMKAAQNATVAASQSPVPTSQDLSSVLVQAAVVDAPTPVDAGAL